MSEASSLAALAVYYCMLVSWALLLHTVPYVIIPIRTVYIIAYGLVNISNILHSLVHSQPWTMLCIATYFVPWALPLLPCAMGNTALYHGTASCIACCGLPWTLLCVISTDYVVCYVLLYICIVSTASYIVCCIAARLCHEHCCFTYCMVSTATYFVTWALRFIMLCTASSYVVYCVLPACFLPWAPLLLIIVCCVATAACFVLWALMLHLIYTVYQCMFCTMGTAASWTHILYAVYCLILCCGYCCFIYCMLCTTACFVPRALLLFILNFVIGNVVLLYRLYCFIYSMP